MKNILFFCIVLFIASPSQALEKANANRLDEVAQRGLHVMPFDLEQTLHIFTKTETCGLQQVLVKEDSNHKQITLIREHLAKIAQDFKQGDFSDPTKIHGNNMPGLAELKSAKLGDITIEYQALSNGAEIHYSTHDPKLIAAIHAWFDAQLSDHARHAVSGSTHHLMHHKP